MRNHTCFAVIYLALASLAFGQDQPTQGKTTVAAPEAAKQSNPFIRIRRSSESEPIALETSIVRYVKADADDSELRIDLIGAVHIADRSYYTQLNEVFTAYDALLYELVAPENARPARRVERVRKKNLLTSAQMGLKSMLDLDFQLEQVDYSRDNFVHADMSPDEFAKSMKDRNESFLKMFFRAMGYSTAMQSKHPERYNDLAMITALLSKNRSLRLKRIMAEQFEDLDGSINSLTGAGGSTIITERNKKAFEVLDREIKAGKRRIGIFYGAGHLPDMVQRLLDDFGMKRTDVKWLSAWSLKPADSTKSQAK